MIPRFVGQDELDEILKNSTKPSIKGSFGREYKNSNKPYAIITFQDTRIQSDPAIMIVTGDDYVRDNCGRYAVVGEEWAKATHSSVTGNSEKLKAEVAQIYRKKINSAPMWSVEYKGRKAKEKAEENAKIAAKDPELAIKKLSSRMREQLESVPHEGFYQGKEAIVAVVSGEWCIYVKKGYLRLGTFDSLESAIAALTPQA